MKGFLQLLFFLLCNIFFYSAKAQVNLQTGLVAYYPFNGNVNDVSGNNHNGIMVNGISFSTDRFGNPNSAAKFLGNDNYVSIPDDGAFSTPNISISLWFKTNSDDLQNLIGKRKFEDDGTQGGGAQYQFFVNYSPYPGIGSNLVGNDNTCSSVTISSYLNTVDPICKERWYHAVVTYDGMYHRVYINGILRRIEATTFSSFLICNSEIRFGVWWTGGTYPFKGLMDDIRWYNRPLNQDEVLALFDDYKYPSPLDFTYSQNPCSPKTLQFFSTNQNAFSYNWNFGNGTSATNTSSPSVDYNSFRNYPVELVVQTSPGCIDTIKKVISVNLTKANKILTSDSEICSGNSLQLSTDSGYDFCWLPNASISTPFTANTTVNPINNTIYTFTSQSPSSASMISNGDFSAGAIGFLSDYTNATTNTNALNGYFSAINNPKSWNSSASNCPDHTSGNGKMLVVNTNNDGDILWKQSIKVQPNKNYVFSFWLQSVASYNPGRLQMSINTNPVGSINTQATATCNWQQQFVSWNSGNADTISLAILNKNNIPGSLIAIDDISFTEVSIQQDSIRITVTPPPNIKTIPDASICKGGSVKLTTTGGTVYQWSPAAGISDPGIESPVAAPDVTSTYTVFAYNAPGCAANDTVTITILPEPAVQITGDTAVCSGTVLQLLVSGGSTYQWSPSAGLNSTAISNPIALPDSTTSYKVSVTDGNGCSSNDSVKITVAAKPFVTTIANTSVCSGNRVTLTTASSSRVSYHWSPGRGLSDSAIASPVATPGNTTDYVVSVTNASNCQAKDTVSLTVLSGPVVSKSRDTTICAGGMAQLTAGGGTAYNWTPAAGLSNPAIANPVATIDTSIVYQVSVTGINGCKSQDSIMVTARSKAAFGIKPASATVCPNDTLLLAASGGDAYEWLPSTPVFSPNVAATLVVPSVATVYKVRISDSVCHNTDTLSASVSLFALPKVSATKSNDIDCSFATAQLSAAGAANYAWSPNAGLSNANISNPVASPAATTVYSVKATNVQGCSGYDSVTVLVSFSGGLNGYLLPSAFTPNHDGKNDCFGIQKWGAVSKLEFSIFNRWGERVFYTSDPSGCWDGTYKSARQDMGTFVYYIKATSLCGGEISRKGTVILIR